MDYEEIAVELAEQGNIAEFGVMPRKQIRTVIEDAIANQGDQCPFVRTYPGVYIARTMASPEHLQASRSLPSEDVLNPIGIITCYGEAWLREFSVGNATPLDFVGCQFQQSPKIDFSKQVGVYALVYQDSGGDQHLVYTVVTGDRTFGECLESHTFGRLAAQWNRFLSVACFRSMRTALSVPCL